MVMTLILILTKLVAIPKNEIYGGIFAIQLYWNHTSAWVISCKFAAGTPFLKNTFG